LQSGGKLLDLSLLGYNDFFEFLYRATLLFCLAARGKSRAVEAKYI